MAPNPPIYDQLVREHGDILTESRQVADETRREVERALDWSTGPIAAPRRPSEN